MDSYLVLIGNAREGSITSFDLTDGTLSPLGTTTVGSPGLPLAVDARRDLVFAGTSEPFGIKVFRLDRGTGLLDAIGEYPANGASVYLTLNRDASLLFSACYHQGVGEVFQVGQDGALTPVGEPIRYGNLHSVQLSADDRFAYFVSLREDLIAQYSFDASGVLTPLDPPTVAAPHDSGPRHLLLDASQTSLYVNTEYSGELLHYRRDPESGVLTMNDSLYFLPAGTELKHSTFGAKPREGHLIWCSELRFDASGRVLYCAERTDGTISTVPLLGDGGLAAPTAHCFVVTQPRSFLVLPNGDLLVASEIDSVVGQYSVDDHGALTEVAQYPVGYGANWLELIER